jgi:predicted RNA binding protein YcfA (HicA-like mRNA interferase family)
MSKRLPSVKAREVIRAPERAGFQISRTSGSHCRLIHRIDPSRQVTVPLHGSNDLKRGTEQGILRQAGLSAEQFNVLLRG